MINVHILFQLQMAIEVYDTVCVIFRHDLKLFHLRETLSFPWFFTVVVFTGY